MQDRMRFATFPMFLLFVFLAAHTAFPEEQEPEWLARPKLEVIAGVGLGHVFRFEDRGYGSHLNSGAGVEVSIWRGLRAGAELNRTFGLAPSPVKCGGISAGPGLPDLPCIGYAREGVGSATAASFTAGYFFGVRRIQPYVSGGISVMRTKEFTSMAIVRRDFVELQEQSSKSTGVGPTIGIGLRASVTRRLSIRPELRLYDATALSSANLSKLRLSVGIGYAW